MRQRLRSEETFNTPKLILTLFQLKRTYCWLQTSCDMYVNKLSACESFHQCHVQKKIYSGTSQFLEHECKREYVCVGVHTNLCACKIVEYVLFLPLSSMTL